MTCEKPGVLQITQGPLDGTEIQYDPQSFHEVTCERNRAYKDDKGKTFFVNPFPTKEERLNRGHSAYLYEEISVQDLVRVMIMFWNSLVARKF